MTRPEYDALIEKVARELAAQYQLADGFSEESAERERTRATHGMWPNFKGPAIATVAIIREALRTPSEVMVEAWLTVITVGWDCDGRDRKMSERDLNAMIEASALMPGDE